VTGLNVFIIWVFSLDYFYLQVAWTHYLTFFLSKLICLWLALMIEFECLFANCYMQKAHIEVEFWLASKII